MQAPMSVMSASTKRETGKKAQLGNIAAAKVERQDNKRVTDFVCNVDSAPEALRSLTMRLAVLKPKATRLFHIGMQDCLDYITSLAFFYDHGGHSCC